MQAPTGPKPSASAIKSKPRPRPSGGKSKAPNSMEGGSANSGKGAGAGAQTLVRKSQGEGGSSKKRAKKSDSDDSTRHGGIGGLLCDDENSADRRAVEELVEAAVGQPSGASQAEKAKQKNGASRKRPPGKFADVAGAAGLAPDAAAASVLGGSPLPSAGAASLLGSLGLGSVSLQHFQEYEELRKRIQQQQLVQQALHMAAQRMQQQQQQSTAAGAVSAAQTDATLPFSLQQPQLSGNGAAAITVIHLCFKGGFCGSLFSPSRVTLGWCVAAACVACILTGTPLCMLIAAAAAAAAAGGRVSLAGRPCSNLGDANAAVLLGHAATQLECCAGARSDQRGSRCALCLCSSRNELLTRC